MSVSPYLLKDQKALVTGANSGIGEAIARYLPQAGAAVAINYVSKPETAEQIVDDIKGAQGEAIAIKKLMLVKRIKLKLCLNRCLRSLVLLIS